MSILTHFYPFDKSIESNSGDMLPGFDTIPIQEPQPKAKSTLRYYLRVQYDGRWYFLWKTHSNGGPEWEAEPMGRKRPLRYKTYGGATRALHNYLPNASIPHAQVAVWKGGAT